MDDQTTSSKLPKAAYILNVILLVSSIDEHMTSSLALLFYRNKLNFSNEEALALAHAVSMASLFISPFGALLTESYGNKYLIMIVQYSAIILMQISLILAAIPAFRSFAHFIIYSKSMFSIGVAIVVNSVPFAFDGNQFNMPAELPALMKFYRIQYLIHNCGVFVGHYLGPLAKTSVACLGEQDCYLLPYGMSLIFGIASLIIFLAGTRLYKNKKPERNMALDITKCVWYGATHWCQERKSNPQKHWLDHAEPKFGTQLVIDIKTAINMLTIFTVIPLYSAVYSQLDREWLLQAARLDGRMGFFTFIPEHFNLVNPVLALILMPIFTNFLDPFIKRWKMDRMFRRMIFGGVMAAISFVLSGCVESKIKLENPILPEQNEVQIRIFNGFNCSCFIHMPVISDRSFEVPAYGAYTNKHVIINVSQTIQVSAEGLCFEPISEIMNADAGTALSIFITYQNGEIYITSYIETVAKTEQGLPILTVIGANYNDSVMVYDSKGVEVPINVITSELAGHIIRTSDNRYVQVVAENYKLIVNGQKKQEFDLHQGGIYLAAICDTVVVMFTITEPNSVHVAWMLPQSIFLIFGEVYYGITLNEFIYSEAPDSLKVLIAALSKFLDGVGEAFVVLVLKLVHIDEDYIFYMYALLLLLNMCWLAFIGRRFKSLQTNEELM